MIKTKDGMYLLNAVELSSLVGASIETATKVWDDPEFDPNESALPYIVNRGYKLLYGRTLYEKEE